MGTSCKSTLRKGTHKAASIEFIALNDDFSPSQRGACCLVRSSSSVLRAPQEVTGSGGEVGEGTMCFCIFVWSGFPWVSIFPPCISSEPGALNGKDSLFSDAMPARDIPFRESPSIKCISQMTLGSLLTQGRRHGREALSEQRPCVIGPAQSDLPSTAVFGEKTQAALSPWIPVSSIVRKQRSCSTGTNVFRAQGLRLRQQVS